MLFYILENQQENEIPNFFISSAQNINMELVANLSLYFTDTSLHVYLRLDS